MSKDIYKDSFSFGEILSKTFTIFSENFRNIFLICLIVYIPINIALFYVGESLLNSPDMSLEDFSNFMKVSGWLENLVGVVASIFVILLVKNSVDGKENIFKEILTKSFTKWAGAAGANILYSIGVGLFLILLIVPGIIFGIYWIFFLYVLVLKDIPATKTFEYSKKLVKGRWWEIFGYGIFSFLTLLFVGLGLGFVPYMDNIAVDISTGIIIDLCGLFMVVLFTLKFLNIDTDIVENGDDKKENKEKLEENNSHEIKSEL